MTKITDKEVVKIRAMRAQKPEPSWASIGRRFGITGQQARYWHASLRERRNLVHPQSKRTAKDGHCGQVEEVLAVVPAYTPHTTVDAIATGIPQIERSALWERLTEEERAALRARTTGGTR